jgi:uncharacterized protein
MLVIAADDERATALVAAIQAGEVTGLQRLLGADPSLSKIRIRDAHGAERTLLHVAADWPGHFPNGPAVVATLIAAGADVNARATHPTSPEITETPLHWAASSDDVAVLDALLDGGADIEAPGAVFTGGPAMSDAVVFAQWKCARRLLERGATTTIWQSAALGLLDRVQRACDESPPPNAATITNALWHACRGGQLAVAQFLVERGADVHWIGHDHKTPLDVAREAKADDLVAWLEGRGARGVREMA